MANETKTTTAKENTETVPTVDLTQVIAAISKDPKAKAEMIKLLSSSADAPQPEQKANAVPAAPINNTLLAVTSSDDDEEEDARSAWTDAAINAGIVAAGVFVGGLALYGTVQLISYLSKE